MDVNELYFKRQERMREDFTDTYQYTNCPSELRVQIFHMLVKVFYDPYLYQALSLLEVLFNRNMRSLITKSNLEFEKINKKFAREKGRFSLKSDTNNVQSPNSYKSIFEFIMTEENIEDFLTIIELLFSVVENTASRTDFARRKNASEIAREVVLELNQRFREHGVGYQYESGQIVRIDSEFIHLETVKPALQLLSKPIYNGAQKEFLKAHEHYRHQRYSEALVECLKAYESTLKIILDKNKWEYSSNATADELTGRVMQSGLVPDFWQQHFKSLKNTLTSGVPTARNKVAGHGAGNEVREIPEYLVSYILHMTASTIVFLVKADEALG